MTDGGEKYIDYLEMLRKPFTKLCRLRFLNPDGSTAFVLDNNPSGKNTGAFIAEGNLSANLQNGQRRSVSVTLSNVDGEFDYNVNNLWFGTEIALDEGLVLSNGEEFYLQQGIFVVETPTETVNPQNRTMEYSLVDKWANLDGTLFGSLEGTYIVEAGLNIFEPIVELLTEDRGNGRSVDNITPVFTEYYNGKTQELPEGGQALMTNAPYTLSVNSESGTIADVVLGLAEMVNAWVGYGSSGELRIDPSQDDISDASKPVLWQFSQEEAELLGMTYTVKNTEVYNDYIVIGEQLSDNKQASGRAQNTNPASDTNIALIGRKTVRVSAPGYATDKMCQDLAEWKLKRSMILQKAVNISCSQMFHIEENKIVTVVRTDKPGSPVERHLVMGFTRPLASTQPMTISAVSANDIDTGKL